jgi:hypothetical protein
MISTHRDNYWLSEEPMTHRSPYPRRPRDLRLAASVRSRDSRHAAAGWPRGRCWLRIRPVVRLVVAAAAAVAGLCIVFVAVAVVARITALPPAGPGTAAAPRPPAAALASMGAAWSPAGTHATRARPDPSGPRRCPPLPGVRSWLGLDGACPGHPHRPRASPAG